MQLKSLHLTTYFFFSRIATLPDLVYHLYFIFSKAFTTILFSHSIDPSFRQRDSRRMYLQCALPKLHVVQSSKLLDSLYFTAYRTMESEYNSLYSYQVLQSVIESNFLKSEIDFTCCSYD